MGTVRAGRGADGSRRRADGCMDGVGGKSRCKGVTREGPSQRGAVRPSIGRMQSITEGSHGRSSTHEDARIRYRRSAARGSDGKDETRATALRAHARARSFFFATRRSCRRREVHCSFARAHETINVSASYLQGVIAGRRPGTGAAAPPNDDLVAVGNFRPQGRAHPGKKTAAARAGPCRPQCQPPPHRQKLWIVCMSPWHRSIQAAELGGQCGQPMARATSARVRQAQSTTRTCARNIRKKTHPAGRGRPGSGPPWPAWPGSRQCAWCRGVLWRARCELENARVAVYVSEFFTGAIWW
jgi:hypothetical protein